MRRLLVCCFLVLCPGLVLATSIPPKELTELVADSDHILIGKVIKVDMIDGQDRQVTGKEARTGPGLDNLIRLHVQVEADGYLRSNRPKVAQTLVIPLWSAWHYSLDRWKEEQGKSFLFLLKGPEYEKVYPALFMRSLDERAKIEKLLGEP